MALTISRGKNLPIGVDLGSAAVKMVQMRRSDEGLQLLAAGSVEIPGNCRDNLDSRMEYHARGIRSLLKTDIFKSRQCVLSLPAELSFVHHVKIPKLAASEMPDAVQAELAEKLPFPVQEAIVRYILAGDVYGDGGAQQEVITVAAARSTIDDFLAMSRRAKLDVVGINVEPCAIVECFARLFRNSPEEDRTTLYVDMGQSSTQVVLARGARITFARNLAVGGQWLDKIVAAGLGTPIDEASQLRRNVAAGKVPPAEANHVYELLDESVGKLAENLTQCMRYHESVFPNEGVERLVLLGGQAYDKRLCQAVAQRLNLAAHIGDPLVKISRQGAATLTTGLDMTGAQPDWAVAVGLSLGSANAA